MKKKDYKEALHGLQVELVKLQRHIIETRLRVLVILEGRDASGKDGTIKRIVQHLSPRETRVVALGRPSERDDRAWYFQRYVPHLPVDGELVLFNRSWYNRAGVEKVMHFCTRQEYETFMQTVTVFEDLLIGSGLHLIKYYLNISRGEQERRLEARRRDPLTQWKSSPVDDSALEHWSAYSKAHADMIERTHTKNSPWFIVQADDKRSTRLNVIRDLLNKLAAPDNDESLCVPDPEVVLRYHEDLPLRELIPV